MTSPKKTPKPRHLIKSIQIKYSEGKVGKKVLLYPYLTEALIGIVEDGYKIRAVYDEESTLKIFLSEGMSKIDAQSLMENHKHSPKDKSKNLPLFIKLARQVK